MNGDKLVKAALGRIADILIPDASFYAPNSLVLGVYQFAAFFPTTDDPTADFIAVMNSLRTSNSSLGDAVVGGGDARQLFDIPAKIGEARIFGWVNRNNDEAGFIKVQMLVSTSSPVQFGFTITGNVLDTLQLNGNQLFSVQWNDVSNNMQNIFVNISSGNNNEGQLRFQFGISTAGPTGTIGNNFDRFNAANFQF
jgi:hypothetical protein